MAVVDTGVDYTHPDLAANMWSNINEVAGNGVDDDNDGRADFLVAGGGDPGCAGPGDTSEHSAVACDDGIDNDNDGRADFNLTASLTDPGGKAGEM